MDNYISKQSVFDIIKNTKHFYADPLSYKYVVNLLKELPNITQVTPIGHWIIHEHAEEFLGRVVDNYECSECHDWYLNKTNYCPSCGAKMVEETMREYIERRFDEIHYKGVEPFEGR